MRQFIWICTLFTPLILLGCASVSVKSTYTAAGSEGFQIICGGFFETGDLGACYQKAGELCGTKGYSITQTNISSIIIQCKSVENSSLITR